jgi:TM2 domain-containing membrane protein YozV
MDCANHSGVNAIAYCQNCGKPMCQACVRNAPGGQIFCEPCMTAWSAAANAQHPFFTAQPGAPSPQLAAVLGVIPGVGAMYNGQFIKGLIHVMIFAVLVSASHVFGLFGLLIAGWVFYQVFDAYHTAKARRDGEPLPDPLGLNDVGSWLGVGTRTQSWTHPGAPPPNAGAGPASAGQTSTGAPTGPAAGPASSYHAGTYPPPYESAFQPGTQQQANWQTPYQGTTASAAGAQSMNAPGSSTNPGPEPVPAIPPVPPMRWRRPEPIGAVILIALGLLFLLNKIDFLSGRVFEFTWPVVLIGLGVWMIMRNVGHSQGGQK